MNIFFDEHKIILKELIKYKVEFILIGGYAVIYHGYNRVTGDLDIWLKPDNENKIKLTNALAALGFDKNGISVIENWDFTKPQIFYIGKEPQRTDFMNFIAGVKFSEAFVNAVGTEIDNLPIRVMHLDNLIQNKISTGRTKDFADVEYLKKILNLKKK